MNKFECLRVSYEGQGEHFKGVLYPLIEEALSWRNSHQIVAGKMEEGKMVCEKCGQKIKEFLSYVNLPNNLILEFGEELNGLNVELPDEIDLGKFGEKYVRKKEDSGGIYEYVGSIVRREKRYWTQVKRGKKEFVFRDETINEASRSHLNVKVALYRRRADVKNQPLLKNIRSCLEVGLNPVVPLPDFWNVSISEISNVIRFLLKDNSLEPRFEPHPVFGTNSSITWDFWTEYVVSEPDLRFNSRIDMKLIFIVKMKNFLNTRKRVSGIRYFQENFIIIKWRAILGRIIMQ